MMTLKERNQVTAEIVGKIMGLIEEDSRVPEESRSSMLVAISASLRAIYLTPLSEKERQVSLVAIDALQALVLQEYLELQLEEHMREAAEAVTRG